jgi:hypothetical protein
VIDLVPADETAAAAKARSDKRDWLEAHKYTAMGISAVDIDSDIAAVLARIELAIGQTPPGWN